MSLTYALKHHDLFLFGLNDAERRRKARRSMKKSKTDRKKHTR